ncbi:hypothetical protein BKA69DRAFT_821291 [Paraphysoderma sedebokerense]|nr:hypothetical protein BKA69DRAFT_821291 [Paraphysoderma sedebokerense]
MSSPHASHSTPGAIAAVCVVFALEAIFSIVHTRGLGYLWKSKAYLCLTAATILNALHGYLISGLETWFNVVSNAGIMFVCMFVMDLADILYYYADGLRLNALTTTSPTLNKISKFLVAAGIFVNVWDFWFWNVFHMDLNAWLWLNQSSPSFIAYTQTAVDIGLAIAFVIAAREKLALNSKANLKTLVDTVIVCESIITIVCIVWIITYIYPSSIGNPPSIVVASIEVLIGMLKCRIRFHEFQALATLIKNGNESRGRGPSTSNGFSSTGISNGASKTIDTA